MTESCVAQVVDMQMCRAVEADAGEKCRQLLRHHVVSDEALFSMLARAAIQGRSHALQVLLEHAHKRSSANVRSALDACCDKAPAVTMVVILSFLATRFPGARLRVPVFHACLARISYVHGVSEFADAVKCAALLIVHTESPDDRQRMLCALAQDVESATSATRWSAVVTQKQRIEALVSINSEPMLMWAAFALMRNRATEICIGLQDLGLPALCTIEILEAACYPAAAHPRLHTVWRLVTAVKHFGQS